MLVWRGFLSYHVNRNWICRLPIWENIYTTRGVRPRRPLAYSVVITADEVEFRLAAGFSQRWQVSGTGRDGEVIAGQVAEIYFDIESGNAQLAVA